MLVPLIVAVGASAVVPVFIAFPADGIGRVERLLIERGNVGSDVLIHGSVFTR
jgi:hypothetical protein